MTTETIEFIKVIPSVLWAVLFLIVFIALYVPVRDQVLPKLTGFKALGVEISFVSASIDAAIELAEKSSNWKVEVSPQAKAQVLRRTRRHLDIFVESKILWVDDHPENNVNECRMFRQLRAEVDVAKTSGQASEMLRHGNYDVVVSDISRDGDATAGLKGADLFRSQGPTPVIFYVGTYDPKKGVPANAFGITNDPAELLHLTPDVLESQRV